jgi:hypothetical protein
MTRKNHRNSKNTCSQSSSSCDESVGSLVYLLTMPLTVAVVDDTLNHVCLGHRRAVAVVQEDSHFCIWVRYLGRGYSVFLFTAGLCLFTQSRMTLASLPVT